MADTQNRGLDVAEPYSFKCSHSSAVIRVRSFGCGDAIQGGWQMDGLTVSTLAEDYARKSSKNALP